MTADKLKQYIAFFGGALSALYLFLETVDVKLEQFNQVSIEAFVAFLTALVPLILVAYGIYKNQYLVTKKAKEAEAELIRKGLK